MENVGDFPPPVVQEFLVQHPLQTITNLLEHASLHPQMNALCVCKGLRDGHARKPSLLTAPDRSHWSFCVPLMHISVFTQRRPRAISLHRARICAEDQKRDRKSVV